MDKMDDVLSPMCRSIHRQCAEHDEVRKRSVDWRWLTLLATYLFSVQNEWHKSTLIQINKDITISWLSGWITQQLSTISRPYFTMINCNLLISSTYVKFLSICNIIPSSPTQDVCCNGTSYDLGRSRWCGYYCRCSTLSSHYLWWYVVFSFSLFFKYIRLDLTTSTNTSPFILDN